MKPERGRRGAVTTEPVTEIGAGSELTILTLSVAVESATGIPNQTTPPWPAAATRVTMGVLPDGFNQYGAQALASTASIQGGLGTTGARLSH